MTEEYGKCMIMQKTRLGITVGALGAMTCFAGFFGGYLVVILLAGYVLLFEENMWLQRIVVKTVVLMVFFSILVSVLNLIPDALGFVGDIAAVFDGHFSVAKVNQVVTVLIGGISIVEKVLFLGLGFKALHQRTIVIPLIDSAVSEYMD